jgi:hypothetical protein
MKIRGQNSRGQYLLIQLFTEKSIILQAFTSEKERSIKLPSDKDSVPEAETRQRTRQKKLLQLYGLYTGISDLCGLCLLLCESYFRFW